MKNNNMECTIPVLTLKSGRYKYKSKKIQEINEEQGYFLIYNENSRCLKFEMKDKVTLHCSDITAADLRVTSKFGSWDTLTCRLLVECSAPLNVINQQQECTVSNAFKKHESCMVKATFEVSHTTVLKQILHSVKVEKLRERAHLQQQHYLGLDYDTPMPSKIREGLPNWVNYVPVKWYSKKTRTVLEYLIVAYTVLTLLWAVWQLYKHVAFIQTYLRPIVEFLQYYLHLLHDWFYWLDALAESLNRVWWRVVKPVYLLLTPIYVAFAQLFKPLRNVAGIVQTLLAPLVGCAKTLFTFILLLLQPFVSVWRAVAQIGKQLWLVVSQNAHVHVVFAKIHETGVFTFCNQILHGNIDPIRAPVIVMRDIVYKSVRQLYYGLRFICSRLYFTHMFVQRERLYAQEGQQQQKEKEA